MTSAENRLSERTRSPRRISSAFAAVGLFAAAALAFFRPYDFASAYRFAGFVCLDLALGSLIFLLIFRSTGGVWGETLLPFFQTGVRFLPWIWLLLLPLLWWSPRFPAPSKPAEGALRIYLNSPALEVRSLVYAVVFFLFWWLVAPLSTRPRRMRAEPYPWFGPVGLIVLVFMLHLLAVDWLFALEPGWTSTAFPLIWMAGQAMMGISLAVLTAIICGQNPAQKDFPSLAPADPPPLILPRAPRALGLDWGNLLLTCIVFWAYVSFMQFLIIWSGNEAREVTFYVHRGYGLWRVLVIALAGCNLALPFFLLLSRRLKQRPAGLSGVALLLLISQLFYTAWLILPADSDATAYSYALDAALVVGATGLFFNRYLAAAVRSVSTDELA